MSMYLRVVIFVAISAFLLAAIYSSSVNYALAKTTTPCAFKYRTPLGISGFSLADGCKIETDDMGKIISAKCFGMVCAKDGTCAYSQPLGPGESHASP